MHIATEQAQGRVPVTVLGIHGDLDASNFEEVIARARAVYAEGARHLLLDMSSMPFMGSSGLVALYSIAVLFRGETPPDPESGWQAFHSMGLDLATGRQQHVKLLNPQAKVGKTLQLTGMDDFFEIYTDLQTALASF